MRKNLLRLLIAPFLLFLDVHSQPQWSTPVAILPNSPNEEHPTFAEGVGWMFGSQREWLAFSRNGKEICVVRNLIAGWDTTITVVSNDTAGNTRPSMARKNGFPPVPEEGMLVWQGRAGGNYDIYYATYRDSQWSLPRALTNHPVDDINPHVVAADSIYKVVWERKGKIYYAEFARGGWSPPQLISRPGDSLNHFPRLLDQPYSAFYPVVAWEKPVARDSSHALWYTHRISGTWMPAESLYYTGNNRRPKFLKYMFVDAIVWESHSPSAVTCNAAYLTRSGNKLRMGTPTGLTNPPGQQANPSINGYMVITAPYLQPTNVSYSVAAWEARDYPIDSIGVSVTPYNWLPNVKLSAGGNTSSHNPDVSQGIVIPVGFVRIWVVWEARRSNRSKLYGSYIDLPIGNVNKDDPTASMFTLHQNYPNPFNPGTTITVEIARRTDVRLAIFDILGREISVLADHQLEPGMHTFNWNGVTAEGKQAASGIYFYRVQTDGRSETRRMLLVR